MNALVPIGGNSAGIMSSTPGQRAKALESIYSNSAAKVSSIIKQVTGGSQKSADVAKADTDDSKESGASVMNSDLDRQAFLELLVTELQHQDPMEPVNNAEMLAQLAQFAALEQMEALNQKFDTMSGNIDQLNFISANGLIGRTVAGVNEDGKVVNGQVDSVHMDGSLVYLNIDGELLSMARVLSVE